MADPTPVPREDLVELIRSIAEYDEYMAYQEPPKGTSLEEAARRGLEFDHEVLENITRKAKALYLKLKESHEL
jgi:hypothetical protein